LSIAVTAVHIASGERETCSDMPTQGANRKKALRTLQARIWAKTNVLHSEDKFTFEFGEKTND